MDDERRKLWKQIDDYAEGKQATLELDAKRPEYSENAVVRGFEIARQIKRLKQNITNSKTAAERAGKRESRLFCRTHSTGLLNTKLN
ncbi:hypothetical protein NXW84_06400 [Bacteroides fragilis]|nr:hypothetical protein NXW84_06400 [Bacteroides fragilis]